MADRERDAAWPSQSESVSRERLVRELNAKLRLRGEEIRRLQARIDSLKTRVGVLEP